MIYNWVSLGQNYQEYHSFSRWPKYIKLFLSADQSSLVTVAATDRTRTRFLKTNRAKTRVLHQGHYTLPGEAIWATLDMCSLCTNMAQEDEIEIVCRHYEEHYQSNLPIPTSYIFGGLNATYLKRKLIQIQRQTLRTDTRHLQWAPKWRFMLSRSFSWLTLINN